MSAVRVIDLAPAPFEEVVAHRVDVIDPRTDPRWQGFVENHDSALVFHGREWVASLAAAFGFRPRFHVLTDDKDDIVAAWPSMLVRSRITGNRMVCLPFCHRAGPLVESTYQGEVLLSAVLADAKRLEAPALEIRDWPRDIEVPQGLCAVNYYSAHTIDLSSGVDAVWKRLDKDMRYSIRRAERNGVLVREASGEADLDTFYRLYKAQRRRQGLLPQPKSFIKEIYRRLIRSGSGLLVIAEHEGTPVAGLLSVADKRVVVGTHTGADLKARGLRATPLSIWRCIEWACERGLWAYDLGRSDAEAAGLNHFKEGWGATRQQLQYLYYPEPRGVNAGPPSSLQAALLKTYTRFTPEPVFSSFSSVLYRHLG